MWAVGLGQVEQWHARQLGITNKRIPGAAAKDQQPNYQNITLPLPLPLPLLLFFFLTLSSSLYLVSATCN
jgi:hypothetical protein